MKKRRFLIYASNLSPCGCPWMLQAPVFLYARAADVPPWAGDLRCCGCPLALFQWMCCLCVCLHVLGWVYMCGPRECMWSVPVSGKLGFFSSPLLLVVGAQ